jgi:hypothetical protein
MTNFNLCKTKSINKLTRIHKVVNPFNYCYLTEDIPTFTNAIYQTKINMNKVLKTFIVLFFVANTAFSQVPGNVPINGLEAWWSFTGNANDLSGNGNNMTNSGATLTTDRNGAMSSAYAFSGSNQYLSVPVPSFTFGATDSFTISYWQRKPSNSYGLALMNSSSTNGNFIWLFQTGTTGNYQFGTNKQGSAWSWAQTTHATNQWEHFVGTYANGSMVLYKNGVQVATSSYIHANANKVNLPLWIGRGHNPNFFTGDLDDIGIWSRVLTQGEIDLLFLNCSAEVTLQPADFATTTGGNAEFGIEGSKAGLSYQWQSDSSGSFLDIANSAIYQGADTDTLDIIGALATMDNLNFRCVVSDSTLCHDTSMTAVLNVCGNFTSQPTTQTVPVNATVYFGVSSNDPNATYQWQISSGTSFIDLVNNTFYTGTQTDTLKLTPATMLFNGKEYRCVMNTSVCFDTSSIAILTVADNISIEEYGMNGIKVYPNPAKDILNLNVLNTNINSDFRITNALGQTVYSGKLKSEETRIDISSFVTGNYFLIVEEKAHISFAIIN